MARPEAKPRKRSNASLFIGLGIVAIIAAVFFFTTYAINWSSAKHFQYEGREVQGKIESVNWSTTHILYLSYSYSDEFGNAHHGTDSYPQNGAKELKEGEAIDIIYLANTPEKSRIGAHQSQMMRNLAIAPWYKIGSMALGGLLCIALGVHMRGRRM